MNFCSECGARVEVAIPEGDNRPRHVCRSCGAVHYQNPKIIAGCIPEWEGRILLCRRAIEPRYGLWTLPAGFMEMGESTLQAAAREAYEEARADLDEPHLFALYNLTHIDQVYILFRGRLRDGLASPGEESLEVALFSEEQIPWQRLAFPVVGETLERYFDDRRNGLFRLHSADIYRDEQQQVQIVRHEPVNGESTTFQAVQP